MPIPNPNDPTTSAAYVDPQGYVRVKDGISAPQTAVGVVGFVPNMVMLWKGLAAAKPKGWVIESAPAGSYLKIAFDDSEMGVTGGSATSTAPDHVHTIAHTHSHAHSLSAHTHDVVDHDHTGLVSEDPGGNTGDSDSGTTLGPSSTNDVNDTGIAPQTTVADAVHTHDTTDHNHSYPAHDHIITPDGAQTSDVPTPDTTDDDATAPSVANTGGVVAPPIAIDILPLFYGLYLIRYVGAP